MMIFFRNILLVILACMFLGSCSRSKTIPDEKLEQIFEEIFLVNSYYNTVGDKSPLDTVDIYRPILEKYGYRVRDLTYTIENYSKRKSAKISDLVENTIRRLEAGERQYTALVAARDTINARARRQFTKVVYYDTAISVTSLADTSRLRIAIPVTEGDYTITYRYMIDSLDQNGRPRSLYELYNEHWYRTDNSSHGLNPRRHSYHMATMTAAPYDHTLVMKLAGYGADMDRPHVYIDSIKVTYNPPIEVALDSLVRYNVRQVFKFPDQYAGPAKNSGARVVNPPRLPQRGDDNR